MAKTMSASEDQVTDGQIDTVVDQLRAAMRKHRAELPKGVAQQILGVQNLGTELYSVVRKYAEAMSNVFIRRVIVDRTRSPQAALDATGRKQYVDRDVVETMPRGEGVGVEAVFFKPEASEYGQDGWISDDDLEKAFDFRGLKPIDPYSLGAINEADLAFADSHPNGTHWKDGKGKWCFATFVRWDGERDVYVDRSGSYWDGLWFFGGVRK